MGESGLCPHLTPGSLLTSTALGRPVNPDAPPTTETKRRSPHPENNDMKVSDLQYCFILIESLTRHLPPACRLDYLSVRRAERSISPQKIQDRILNEEGRRSGSLRIPKQDRLLSNASER